MAVQVVSWAIDEAPADLRPSEMLVLMLLAEHASEDGAHAYPSVPLLAEKTRLGQRTVQLALRGLLKRGLIAVECRATNRLPTMYCFPLYRGANTAPQMLNGSADDVSLGVQFTAFGGAKDAPQENLGVQNTALGVQFTALGVQNTASRGADSADKPLEEPSVKPPEEPSGGAPAPADKPKRKKQATELPEDWEDQQKWGDLYDWAKHELGMNEQKVDFETDKFTDHWRGNGELKVDWLATWRNWLRRSQEGFQRRAR